MVPKYKTNLFVIQVPNSAPPPPPIRNTSIRNGGMSPCTDIEARFSEFFHPVHDFPTPQPFRDEKKVYNSKNGKSDLMYI